MRSLKNLKKNEIYMKMKSKKKNYAKIIEENRKKENE